MARKYETIYMKIPTEIVQQLKRLANTERRTIAAQAALMIEESFERRGIYFGEKVKQALGSTTD
jgi:hypothetical protein